jgi:hypothetical protein
MSAIGLPPFGDIDRSILGRLLNPTNGLPPEAQAVLRTKLNLPAEKSAGTNAVPTEAQGTNAP